MMQRIDFCFQINKEELENLRYQNDATKISFKRRYCPYAYTEHGIIALAGVLKNEIASRMSAEIVRKFVQMRKFILENEDILLSIAKLQNRQLEFENETNIRFEKLFNLTTKFDLPKIALFYTGQLYDAFDFITNIINKASNSIILIDPYCDKKALTFLSHKKDNVSILLIKNSKSKLSNEEIETFESQYENITIKVFDDIHDRYLIIDNEECYSLGTSLNNAGKKLFTINRIEDIDIIKLIIKKINNCF